MVYPFADVTTWGNSLFHHPSFLRFQLAPSLSISPLQIFIILALDFDNLAFTIIAIKIVSAAHLNKSHFSAGLAPLVQSVTLLSCYVEDSASLY